MVALITVPSALAQPRAQSFAASLTPIAGTVQYLPSGRTQWVNVSQVTLINEGDQIRTADDGIARLSVVTGIEVEIYPTSWVVLNDLALGQTNDGALTFKLGQLVGGTFITVNRALDAQDRVQILTPGASATVRGTQFYVFVTPKLNISILPAQDNIVVETVDGRRFTLTPNDLARILLDIDPAPLVCSVTFLRDNAKATTLVNIIQSDSQVQALREFLLDSLKSNVNPEVRTFLRQLLNLGTVNFSTLSDDEDQAELQVLLQTLGQF